MSLFKKKNKKELNSSFNYTTFDEDFKFLNMIMTRKKNITKEFQINTFSTQQAEKDFLRDEDIEPHILNITNETIGSIGDNYKNFLVSKYFGSIENLIKFIAEEIYVSLVSEVINKNAEKTTKLVRKTVIESISNLNRNKKDNK